MDTKTDGRLDVVIFPNGGREFLGRQPSYPETAESLYLPEVEKFVALHQGLETPEKYTGYYTVKGDVLTINWGEYAGEIVVEQQEIVMPDMTKYGIYDNIGEMQEPEPELSEDWQLP